MNRFERWRKKGLALLLSVIMAAGLFPLSAIAEDDGSETEPVVIAAPSEQPVETSDPTESPAEDQKTPEESQEPNETPAAEAPEATEAPEETPTPTPVPKPDYLFTKETVYLVEILKAVGKKITKNATLSVDSDRVKLSETEVETEDEEKLNLERITLTATGTFALATLTVTTETDVMTITLGYPEKKPVELAYTFANTGDALDLSALLAENGIEADALRDVSVREGDESAIELKEEGGAWTVTALAAFDRIVLRMYAGEEKVDVVLSVRQGTQQKPEGKVLHISDSVYLSGALPEDVEAEASPATAVIKTGLVLAAYDLRVNSGEPQKRNGGAWADEPITVHLYSESFGAKRLAVYCVAGDGEGERIAIVDAEDGWIAFDAAADGLYAVVELETLVAAGDGNTYRITAEYDLSAGIPVEGTALSVREITEQDPDYRFYLNESMKAVGTDADHLGFARAFDVKIVDAADSTHVYEPRGKVRVTVTLVDSELKDYADVNVVHFAGDGRKEDAKVTAIAPEVRGDSVTFSTDHFSVYVVNGTVHTRTFYFYTLNEYLEYEAYWLNTDTENPAYVQIVREGEYPVAPQNPVNPQDQEATFAGWYRGSANPTDPQLWSTPYDFSQPLDIDEDDVVHLYAKFTHYVYVVFHDQYDAASGTFPIAFTRRLDLLGENEEDWYVDIRDYSVSYQDPNDVDDNAMVFVGWSEDPITTPGAQLNDYGDTAVEVTNDNGKVYVTGTMHLYPMYKPVKWISFYSGPSGSHATFFTDKYYIDGVGPKQLPGDEMTRDGNYAFVGWYIGAVINEDDTAADFTNAVQLSDEHGNLIPNAQYPAQDPAVAVQHVNATGAPGTSGYVDAYDYLRLYGNIALVACWEERTTANYTVIVRRQKILSGQTEQKPNVADREYEFADRFVYTGTIGDTIALDDLADAVALKEMNTLPGYNTMYPGALTSNDDNPYKGYVFNWQATNIANNPDAADPANTPSDLTVRADGSETILICYDWNGWPNLPAKVNTPYTLKFVDPMDIDAETGEPRVIPFVDPGNTISYPEQNVLYGAALAGHLPADPVSGVSEEGLLFEGWYADENCITRVYFDAASFNSSTAQSKVLYTTMPGADLTLYAGWEKQWFLIKIDPNYGELYKKTVSGGVETFTGTGSTWMWKEYGDTFQEYVTVKRDYVESDSGSWYYVKHDRAYHGYPDAWVSGESSERKTYYTQTMSEATEFTTFEYDPGIYRYAGWYEVLFDEQGNEIGEANERYDFETPVDHNITLRLRWQKVGAFYIEYNPGAGTMDREDENETLYVELENGAYCDDANVVVTRVATPPEGYEFVGWRIRSDESETIYRPGESFHLLSKHTATVQGKRTLFLDAVYQQVPTVRLVYHANGGTMNGDSVNYGRPADDALTGYRTDYDTEDQTATIYELPNNVEFILSSGAGFSRAFGAETSALAGWCENPVFDPEDEEHPLLTPGGTYRVGANAGETQEERAVHLYAIWAVDVRYHLNQSTADANFGGDWNDMFTPPLVVYTPEGTNTTDLYTQTGVHIGSTLSWPAHDPVYTGAGDKTFLGWTRTQKADNAPLSDGDLYDFSEPVEGPLDLYAYWAGAYQTTAVLADSTAQTIVDRTTAWGGGTISLSSAHKTPAEIIAASAFTVPANYSFAFATVKSQSMNLQYLQEDPVSEIYYKTQDGKVHIVYAGGRDEALGEDEEICFVFFENRILTVGYIEVQGSGKLKKLTVSDPDAPHQTTALGQGDVYTMPDKILAPMAWTNNEYSYYSYAIGEPTIVDDFTDAVDLHLKTDAFASDSERPRLRVRNTWRGFEYSSNLGATWHEIGYDIALYVAYYSDMPTFVTFDVNAIGFAADRYREYDFDYWIEKISLADGSVLEKTFTTIPGAGDGTTTFLYHGTGPIKLDKAATFSTFLLTDPNAATPYTFRVTIAQRLEPGFTAAAPQSIPNDLSFTSGLQGWDASVHDNSRTYAYTAYDAAHSSVFGDTQDSPDYGGTHYVHFTDTREVVYVDLHVARINTDGNIFHRPEWRVPARDPSSTVEDPANAYTVTLQRNASVVLTTAYPDTVVAPMSVTDEAARAHSAFAGVLYGQDRHTSAVHPEGGYGEDDKITVQPGIPMGCTVLSFEPVDPADPTVYDLYLKDGTGAGAHRYRLSELTEQIAGNVNGITYPHSNLAMYRLFYVFYPELTIHYVLEHSDGTLSLITGSNDGTNVINAVTYDRAPLTLNGRTVTQTQYISVPAAGISISQTVGTDHHGNPFFNIPPILDNGIHNLDLIYYKIGARPQSDPDFVAPNTGEEYFPGKASNDYTNPVTGEVYDAAISEDRELFMRIDNNRHTWIFKDYMDVENSEPITITEWPVVYAIYRERGYNLTISKTVPVDTGYDEPFTITLESESLHRNRYPVSGTGYNYIEATPAHPDESDPTVTVPGRITFDVKDGDSITVSGLEPGTYTVTETGNENFTLTARAREAVDGAVFTDATVTGNSTFTGPLRANTELALTNTPAYICKIGNRKFHTISEAVDYIIAYSADFTETIEMLVPSYLMPQSDTPEIPSYLHVTLTTAAPDAEDPDNKITTSGQKAVILRKDNLTGPMFNNLGVFTLQNVELNGNSGTFSAPLINNEGTLNVTAGARLCNAASDGEGGAIYSLKGTVDMTGGTIEGCSALRGGAIYAAGGTVGISGGTIRGNTATEGGAICYAGSDTVTVSGGTIGESGHANAAENGAAIYMASGTANVTGGTISYNAASGCGGAIYALNAYVNVNGGTILGNTAAVNGGAVHMETLTFKLLSGSVTNNSAADGGAIWAGTGSVEISGGRMVDNEATTGSGGAVYAESSAFIMTGGTIQDSIARQNGGAVYANTGSVTVSGSGTVIKSNNALTGNGGGIYAASGTVTMDNVQEFRGNEAKAGNGGALYVDSGAATLTGVQIGRQPREGYDDRNEAVNGSAVFVNTGVLTLKSNSNRYCTINYNVASNGGAIGVGSTDARLNFYDNVVVQNNTMAVEGGDPKKSNVYLNFDTDTIINFQSVGARADIGIYVADNVLSKRGVPGARFGVYVTIANDRVGKITNDRTANLVNRLETTNKKTYWARDFTVKVYYVADYSRGLPFGGPDYTNNFTTTVNGGSNGGKFVRQANGTPPSYESAISEVAEDIRRLGRIAPTDAANNSAVFGHAFVQQATVGDMDYSDYLTEIKWNTETSLWQFFTQDGDTISGGANPNEKKTLIFIYTEPYFLSIENNAKDALDNGLTLKVTDLTVTVNGVQQSVVGNYGYLFSRNDAIEDILLPVTEDDLVLGPGDSVRILLPGGKGMPYSMTGEYYSTYDPDDETNNARYSGTVDYRQLLTTDTTPQQIGTGSVNTSAAFTVTGTTPSNSGQTHRLVFGGDRAICRVVANHQITGLSADEYVDSAAGEGATEGKWEYTFSSPQQANRFITSHHEGFWENNDQSSNTVKVAIELLVDYMYPASEQTQLQTGTIKRDITFRTSVDGHFRYDPANTAADGSGEHPRALVSRGSSNLTNFILAANGTRSGSDYWDKLTIEHLRFDGKNFGGDNISGGIVKTKEWNVVIDDVEFINCQAKFGGGIYIESVEPKVGDQTPYGNLTVRNSDFTNCQSKETKDKFGGGAIWTSMRTCELENCTFDSCEAVAQGGAVFHYVGNIATSIETRSTVTDCTFNNCRSKAAGSMELGAKNITVSGCTFKNSTATERNGGALNVWVYDSASSSNASYVTLENSTFENCYALTGSGSNGNGGGMRSTATYNTIINCTFNNTLGTNGGAITISNTNAVDTVISGSRFINCVSRTAGGAVYCVSKTLTINGCDDPEDTDPSDGTDTLDTEVRNCNAANEGGGIYHNNSKSGRWMTMENTTIDTCYSSTKSGGGLYTNAYTVTIADSTVQNCYTSAANQNGGGLHLLSSTTTSIDNTQLIGNTATGVGGGVCHSVGGTFTVTGSVIAGNIAQGVDDETSNNSGGGVYTMAQTFTLKDSEVKENQGAGNGGGICQYYSNSNGNMTVDGSRVTDNISGGMGGGLYTLTNMTMKALKRGEDVISEIVITGNRLTTDEFTKDNAAGVYLRDGVYLDLKLSDNNYAGAQTAMITIKDNMTVDGKPSDLRLPDTTSGEIVNDNKVQVYAGVSGEVRVVNAKKKLTRFGTAMNGVTNPAGFTDEYKVFLADDGSLFGIVDRQDPTGIKIIWGGDPICKITDANGRLLYIDPEHIRPAVFDRLDAGYVVGANGRPVTDAQHNVVLDTTTTSAFSTLRRLDDNVTTLFYADGTAYTGSDYQVKMLIEDYETEYFITSTGGTGRSITLTTAGERDSLYPYRGRKGTRCTILSSTAMDTNYPLITAKSNLTVQNIVLDGGSLNGVTTTANTRIINADYGTYAAIRITLARNAALQNASITGTGEGSSGNGGGVYLNHSAQLYIAGGAIRNCSAVNGGGVYIDGGAGTLNMSVGTITKCTASANGGGVYFKKGIADNADNPTTGIIRISGGSISRCEAQNGGGLYLNAYDSSSRRVYMSGGSISGNHVTGVGGGIAVGDNKAKLYFSGAPYVYQNKSDSTSVPNANAEPDQQAIPSYPGASNVQMDQEFDRTASNPSTIIVSRGLIRGATVGVYVPGEDNNDNTTTLYDKHGAEMDPFATFDGNDKGMNYFVNDRNGMKGGKLEDQTDADKKIYWRIIYALSITKQVLSDDPADNNTIFRFTLQLTGTIYGGGNGVPDTYANDFNGKYGDMTFTNGRTSFTLTNGQTKTADLLPLGFGYRITESFTSSADQAHFKTSVENWDGQIYQGTVVEGQMINPAHFTYAVTYSNLHAICKITDDEGRLLYTQNSDGTYSPAIYSRLVTAFNKVNAGTEVEWYFKDETGRFERVLPEVPNIEMLIPDYEMTTPVGLLRGQKAVLTTADKNAEDGFPYVGGDSTAVIRRGYTGESMITVDTGELTLGQITLDGGSRNNYSSTQNGGAVQVKASSTLTVGTGATIRYSTTEQNGAGIYLAEGGTMRLSGAPRFVDNTVAFANTTALNGGESVYADHTQRQDIYIAGYQNSNAPSLVITGDIGCAAGSIWIATEYARHYEQSKQFAMMEGGVHSGLTAFRNAHPDSQTRNPLNTVPLYLTGVARGNRVHWTGSMDLAISKAVQGEFSDENETFAFTVSNLESGDVIGYTRYTSTDGTNWTQVGAEGELTADANGRITFGLKHHERIVVSIPSDTVVTVSEVYGYYRPAYAIDGGTETNGGSVTLTMDNDKAVAFVNTYNAISPSGVAFRIVPFAIIFGMSVLLVPAAIVGRKRRREEE